MSSRVRWLMQGSEALPSGLDWLAPGETSHLTSLATSSRRGDWLLGRWVAKQALIRSGLVGDPPPRLDQVEVRRKPSGAPRVHLADRELPVSISLSHRAGHAICFLGRQEALGCDLELIEPRSQGFVEDYFNPLERSWIERAPAQSRALIANALWSAKESGLKLLEVGLTLDPRDLEVRSASPIPDVGWRAFTLVYASRSYPGWWCRRGEWVLTVATDVESEPPVRLPRPEKEG